MYIKRVVKPGLRFVYFLKINFFLLVLPWSRFCIYFMDLRDSIHTSSRWFWAHSFLMKFPKLCKDKVSSRAVVLAFWSKTYPLWTADSSYVPALASGKNKSFFSVNIDKPLLTCSFSHGMVAQYPVLSEKRSTSIVPRVKVTIVGDLRENVN